MTRMPSGILVFYCLLLILGLNLPNHERPVPSFWIELFAGGAMLGLAASQARRHPFLRVPARWHILLLIPMLAWAQYASGLLRLSGDALLITLYGLYAWATAVSVATMDRPARARFTTYLLAALLLAWLVGFALQLMQWWGVHSLWLADTGRVRPAGNLTQPNHFATWTVLAACAAIWLREQHAWPRALLHVLSLCFAFSLALAGSRTAYLAVAAATALAWWSAWSVSRHVRESAKEMPDDPPHLREEGLGDRDSPRKATPYTLHGHRPKNDGVICQRLPNEVAHYQGYFMQVLLLTATAVMLRPTIEMALFGVSDAPALARPSSEGERLRLLAFALQATLDKPWAGWGLYQTPLAQVTSSGGAGLAQVLYPSVHNLAADLFVWLGIPLGLCMTGVLGWAFIRALRPAVGQADKLPLQVMLLALSIHALLEYPLYYLMWLGLFVVLLVILVEPPAQGQYAVRSKWLLPVLPRALMHAVILGSGISLGASYVLLQERRAAFYLDGRCNAAHPLSSQIWQRHELTLDLLCASPRPGIQSARHVDIKSSHVARLYEKDQGVNIAMVHAPNSSTTSTQHVLTPPHAGKGVKWHELAVLAGSSEVLHKLYLDPLLSTSERSQILQAGCRLGAFRYYCVSSTH